MYEFSSFEKEAEVDATGHTDAFICAISGKNPNCRKTKPIRQNEVSNCFSALVFLCCVRWCVPAVWCILDDCLTLL